MRALSVAQPWAECIVARGKNVENRTWNTNMRGWFAVHASKARELDRFEACRELFSINIDRDDVPYGAIVGFARLSDVIKRRQVTSRTRRWFGGSHGFVLDDVIQLRAPVPAAGGLGFRRVDPRILRKCMSQLTVTAHGSRTCADRERANPWRARNANVGRKGAHRSERR
jgi:hypothetical protein